MELKTKVNAEEGKQDLVMTRTFNLPVDLLFRAFTEAEFLEAWMNTTVLHFDMRKHGSYIFETKMPNGEVAFQANGVIHDVIPDSTIIRTFQMDNAPWGVQFEILTFEAIDEDNSMLNMHMIFKSVADRDALLKLPFAAGANMAHNKLEEVLSKLK